MAAVSSVSKYYNNGDRDDEYEDMEDMEDDKYEDMRIWRRMNMRIWRMIMRMMKINLIVRRRMAQVRRKYESYLCSSFFPEHSYLAAASAADTTAGCAATDAAVDADQLDSIPNQMSYINPAPPKTAPHR